MVCSTETNKRSCHLDSVVDWNYLQHSSFCGWENSDPQLVLCLKGACIHVSRKVKSQCPVTSFHGTTDNQIIRRFLCGGKGVMVNAMGIGSSGHDL